MKILQEDKKRFWSFVNKGKGCWEWSGGINSTGRGIFWLNGKTPKAHRISWAINKGKIPVGRLVLHRCDNGKCVRPSHLFLGSYKDNTRDMISKGRSVGNQRLTLESRDLIRSIYGNRDITYKRLGQEFDLSYTTISGIINSHD